GYQRRSGVFPHADASQRRGLLRILRLALQKGEALKFGHPPLTAQGAYGHGELEPVPRRFPIYRRSPFGKEGLDLVQSSRACPKRRPKLGETLVVAGLRRAASGSQCLDCERKAQTRLTATQPSR